jgi:chromosome segregation ATPase
VTNASRHEQQDESSPSSEPDRLGALLRRVFARAPSSEEQLEELMAEHRRELEEYAERFDATVADLERREELIRDSRASVERLLRLGTTDLDARESDLVDLVRELTEREADLRAAEAELTRRRGELGAVELRRAALERREETLAAREEQVAALEARLAEREATSGVDDRPAETVTGVELAFVPGNAYRLLALDHAELATGSAVEVDGKQYLVSRIGPSPLPGDDRRCAYLVQGGRGSSPGGSS